MVRSLDLAWLCPLLLLLLPSCDSVRDEGWAPRRPLGSDLATFTPPLDPAAPGPGAAEPRPGAAEPGPGVVEPDGPLVLRQALALALLHSPDLASAAWQVRMAEARRLQAGLPPNPEIGFDLETLGALRTAEHTLALGQTIFLGGKLELQKRVAALERDLAGWDYEARRINVFTETAKAFVALRAAQEKLAVAEQIADLAERVVETASERVRSGKTSPLEEMKARVELGAVRLGLEQARREVPAARQRLASMWGSTTPRFSGADARFEVATSVPSAERIVALVDQNPDVARWATEMQHRQAVVSLEKARGIPDPTLGGGWKRDGDSDGNGWVAGLAIPLPIFDRNQGAVSEARHGLGQGEAEQRAAQARAHSELADAYQLLATAHAQAAILGAEILPEARKAFEASLEGYRQGKFAHLDVLDAQRTLFESRLQFIEAVAAYHAARANVEGLVGQDLESIEALANKSQENQRCKQ